jgi:AraC-like DNA-binding protein
MTGTPETMTETPQLDEALEQLRLDGAIFFRSEFSESWSFESAPESAAGMLRPGAERLLYFHIVVEGECWTTIGDGERFWASKGDVVVVPYGHQHAMGGAEDAECVPIMKLIDPPPWESLPFLEHGGGGPRCDIVCGYLHSDDPLFDPRMAALPPIFVVRPGEAAQRWVDASIQYALDAAAGRKGAAAAPTRLSELLVTEILRLHLASAPSSDHGWIAALRDPVLAPALAELHSRPEHKWTVAELASSTAVSRSLLDERFRRVLGRPPIRYLTDWRMHLAQGLLSSTTLTVAQVAPRVGYESVEAFSRAFKRAYGKTPSAARA